MSDAPLLLLGSGLRMAAWLNAGMLYYRLRRQKMLSADRRLKRTLPRLLVSAAAMGVALWFAIPPVEGWFGESNAGRIGSMLVLIGGASCLYAGAVLLSGAISLAEIRQQVRRRPIAGNAGGQIGG